MKKASLLFTCLLFLSVSNLLLAQKSNAPIMGWSSWNNFRVNINEQLIKEQADAMITSGLYDAGYRFINIDDGYFGGRDSSGKLLVNQKKFPSGMKSLTSYIHSKGLKAGIYSDAGKNTCGSIYDKDNYGVGSGIYGHIEQDCDLFFKQWGFNFLKVDWCGGEQMKLTEETEYLKIINAVKSIDTNIVFNICRWQFPGTWAIKKADSWRISGDIREKFSSILKIIDLNAELYQYTSAGHFNDMDMLQVGRGMSYDEDKSHFSMWCMMNSPLLAGNDLRNMTKETIEILTNKELIALNQDTAFIQAKRILSENNVELWMKPLANKNGKTKAFAILNRNEEEKSFTITAQQTGFNNKSKVRDLWLHKDLGSFADKLTLTIPKHGVVVLKMEEAE
ncbi:glycoside hydrolase family 27 protein [Chitinophagaceae bacterium LWZ2-11]